MSNQLIYIFMGISLRTLLQKKKLVSLGGRVALLKNMLRARLSEAMSLETTKETYLKKTAELIGNVI